MKHKPEITTHCFEEMSSGQLDPLLDLLAELIAKDIILEHEADQEES